MWPFNRNKQADNLTTEVQSEVQDFYQAEKRERLGVAWLLAIATFFVVVIVVLGLFVGGRAVIRSFSDDDETATETTAPAENGAEPAQPTGNAPASGGQGTEAEPVPTPQPQPQPQPTTVPQTGGSAAELHRTGPTGDD